MSVRDIYIHSANKFALIVLVISISLLGAQNHVVAEERSFGPKWLTLEAGHRTRFEVLDGPNVFGPVDFIDNINGDVFADDEFMRRFNNEPIGLISLQTTIKARAKAGNFSFVAELMDSRSYMPINDGENCEPPDLFVRCTRLLLITTNALEPIQSYLSFEFDGSGPSKNEILMGRFTMDIGSGRLVGRSEFRSTIQSYFGVLGSFALDEDKQLTVFYTLPKPKKFEFDNEINYDNPDIRRHFWGVHYSAKGFVGDLNGELYLYGRYGSLDSNRFFTDRFEEDSELEGLQFTPGVRIYRPVTDEKIGIDVEGAVQISNDPFANRANDEFRNTPNVGYFVHAEIGKQFANSEVSAMFDVASGRRRNYELVNDLPASFGSTNRLRGVAPNFAEFDPLFGAFDDNFGPEGLYGILAYRDILSGAVRVKTELAEGLTAQLTYRASTRFSTNRNAGGITSSGGTFYSSLTELSSGVGHQLDANLRYWIFPDRLKFETGGAVFLQQTIQQEPLFDIPLAGVDDDTLNQNTTLYGYSAISVNF